ncbi:ABC transporter permease [Peribacillus tepidiphilus]|uniref:ABC transporter permease n=1 Tax=Peribacillus tepidiphilus TaxID=2652445 RepID=UPI001782EE83|nr:ABC transporter permease [Peribacillus tepidiphilus]
MNKEHLWRDRFRSFNKEIRKYVQYIFNGHLLFVLLIGLGGIAYYYSEWVKTLDSSFPAEILMAIVIGFVLTNSPILTFFKEPDVIYLLPIEKDLKGYVNKSLLVSLMFQGYLLVMVLAACMPLYVQVTGGAFGDFLYFISVLLIVKYANLKIRWNIQRLPETSSGVIDFIVRFLVNVLFLYFLFLHAPFIYLLVLSIVIGGLWIYFEKIASGKLLKWERLIELENKRMMLFYRVANLFTDVPKLKNKVTRRKWMDFVLHFIPSTHVETYTYLYARTLVRSNDYFGLTLRLSAIGSIILFACNVVWAKLLVVLLFLYLTGFQLLTISVHHDMKMWLHLYPVPETYREQSLMKLLTIILIGQAVIFSLFTWIAGDIVQAIIALTAGILFVIGFRFYMMKKIRSTK